MNANIALQRLANQRINGEKCKTPEEVVRWMGALQAQDYGQALWAIGVRTLAATLKEVEQAISERKILRTWPMRGTIHFVPAEDAKWMLKLTASRILAGDRRRQQQLELDEAIIERAGALFHDTLVGDRCLSRAEMMKILEAGGINPAGQRGYHILWYLSQRGLLCIGPTVEKQQTFVLLDEWAPQAREYSREEALAELTRRYITAHGPATTQDFAWWAGITLSDAKAGFASIKTSLAVEKWDGQEYWMARDGLRGSIGQPGDVHLLAGFDEYMLGYKDRSAVLAAEHAQFIVPGNNGVFLPTIVVAGFISGAWKRTLRKIRVEIELQPFIPLEHLPEQAHEALKRYSEFLEVPFSLKCSSNV